MHETEMIRKWFTAPLRDAFGHRIALRKMGGGPAMQGFIDVVGCFDGVSLWMEAKKQGGKPTALQLDALKSHANAGGLSLLVIFGVRGQQTWHWVTPDRGSLSMEDAASMAHRIKDLAAAAAAGISYPIL